ncbi:DNA-binding domain-containing protein [Treponema sp. HNW]|uniref:DNA-binding domain-containing protein n=1 Tax=Treponema sp. HNW TaxID=3116654 RepID=UPI003D0BC7A8
MAKKKSVWEVYLRPNTLTKENDRDCIADVHAHAATQRNEDIAEIITKERTEFRKETIINILNMRDKAVKDLIQEGVSFMDGLVQISPRVSGVWATENAPYDEKVHKRTVEAYGLHSAARFNVEFRDKRETSHKNSFRFAILKNCSHLKIISNIQLSAA